MSRLDEYLDRQRQQINAALGEVFPEDPAHPHRLIEAVRYGLLDGGKRLRPILVLAACEAAGGAASDAMPAACALEMIHAYSLIHDDLPAMDDDALRRGRPTTHIAFGEDVAILAGDALLTEAFALLARAALQRSDPRRMLAAMAEIAAAAGAHGMVGGQAADLAAEGQAVDLATVEYIHVRKTGALLLAAVRSGAQLGGADATTLQRLTRYGECVGLAFQIADDILDAEGETAQTGKAVGRDQALHKATFPAVLGMPAAKARLRELREQALQALAPLPQAADPLRDLVHFVVARAVGG
ncbi:MAG: polyprenyl synthetase family protein [Deltaproteobacteria bacterium]|nr:polyprenyl synthetase family protein [Deltaproteobacteria bacterium]